MGSQLSTSATCGFRLFELGVRSSLEAQPAKLPSLGRYSLETLNLNLKHTASTTSSHCWHGAGSLYFWWKTKASCLPWLPSPDNRVRRSLHPWWCNAALRVGLGLLVDSNLSAHPSLNIQLACTKSPSEHLTFIEFSSYLAGSTQASCADISTRLLTYISMHDKEHTWKLSQTLIRTCSWRKRKASLAISLPRSSCKVCLCLWLHTALLTNTLHISHNLLREGISKKIAWLKPENRSSALQADFVPRAHTGLKSVIQGSRQAGHRAWNLAWQTHTQVHPWLQLGMWRAMASANWEVCLLGSQRPWNTCDGRARWPLGILCPTRGSPCLDASWSPAPCRARTCLRSSVGGGGGGT